MTQAKWDGVDRRQQPRCSFCGKSRDQVERLLPGPEGSGVAICDQCVALSQELLLGTRPADLPKVKPTRPANIIALREMLEVVEALRAPEGCPWDREQTHATLRPYLLEETYEVLEAIEDGAPEDLMEELGDLLLQVFMHHAIAQESGAFDIAGIATHATAKMVHRHPHVFGETVVAGADEVLTNWEGLKQQEHRKRGRISALEGAPRSLPALAWALSLQKRAARVGFDWADKQGVLDKVGEEAAELAAEHEPQRREEELGDLLFALVNLARHMRVNPEDSLRAAAQRFAHRFEAMEAAVREQGGDLKDMNMDEMNTLWDAAKETTKAR
jgi:tetrapyrrole methylase family protein/MazG family protein